jgi:rubrerythrin
MELSPKDCLKKAILDTQEKVRDYESHAKNIEDSEISSCFKKFAEEEGYQASKLQDLLDNYDN